VHTLRRSARATTRPEGEWHVDVVLSPLPDRARPTRHGSSAGRMSGTACADCGDVLPREQLSWTCDRLLCPICAHAETEASKKAAEIWLLEQMYTGPGEHTPS
jgi:hypothetical protein